MTAWLRLGECRSQRLREAWKAPGAPGQRRARVGRAQNRFPLLTWLITGAGPWHQEALWGHSAAFLLQPGRLGEMETAGGCLEHNVGRG